MKALVKEKADVGLWLKDVPEPELGISDVLIKVKRAAICGTDMHIYNWDDWAQNTIPVPMVVGHEFVGEIVKVGSNVIDFHPGQIVSGEGHVVCSRCRNCMAGHRHLCAHASGIGVNWPGAFAEYVALPMSNVWEHRPGIDLDVASLFDPLGNAVHTALQWDLLGEDVLITGAGPIGSMAAAVCRHAGARHVVITDVVPERLETAKKLGATRTVDVRNQNLKDVQAELGMIEGFDVGLEMSGNSTALNDLIENMCHGGKVSILGIQTKGAEINWETVIFNMLTIKGIYGREMYATWYKMSVMVENGLDISPVITHRLPYQEFQEGFDLMNAGEASKVVLNWEA
ncbi:MAG: L-threonine 3-dehydrogenase [Rhodothermaceae bacterium]|nr:L-threonine 3-dehydrogenase [Rhodothermaceae bacterium]MYD19015.1 L-threonine 3-dehydrogenase [Rhodothermaceae bacterium]MYD55409.1 L-threonine 3-dehydrogenase [Rhodothermaceae bacterium]MYI43396.1 L-threonine 3-dehydrogenase [Rhodothermaceae bacterium]MYJ54805.1 L-threonine 3-dehydrogenase [Rhodothermaceae bacterium]